MQSKQGLVTACLHAQVISALPPPPPPLLAHLPPLPPVHHNFPGQSAMHCNDTHSMKLQSHTSIPCEGFGLLGCLSRSVLERAWVV